VVLSLLHPTSAQGLEIDDQTRFHSVVQAHRQPRTVQRTRRVNHSQSAKEPGRIQGLHTFTSFSSRLCAELPRSGAQSLYECQNPISDGFWACSAHPTPETEHPYPTPEPHSRRRTPRNSQAVDFKLFQYYQFFALGRLFRPLSGTSKGLGQRSTNIRPPLFLLPKNKGVSPLGLGNKGVAFPKSAENRPIPAEKRQKVPISLQKAPKAAVLQTQKNRAFSPRLLPPQSPTPYTANPRPYTRTAPRTMFTTLN
jgi:hypothetical protein